MSIITVFSGSYCDEADVVRMVQSDTGFKLITDGDVASEASRLSGLPEERIRRVFSSKTSLFDRLGRERDRALVYIKLALANLLTRDDLLIAGFSGQLLPKTISHVLRVCFIAEIKYRISTAKKSHGLSEKEAVKRINRRDEDCVSWMITLFKQKDPWDGSLYDIVIPMDKIDNLEAAEIITKNIKKPVVKPTKHSQQAVKDFLLEAQVQEALVNEGHFIEASVSAGAVSLTINRHVLRLGRLEEELRAIVSRVPGVASVSTNVGKGFHKSNVYRRHDFSLPDRVLIVDDEREYGQSLSERLVMCDIGAAISYDGESALDLINEEEPEVMIIDLRMPGIDGFEVLQRVKKTRPEVEVVVLTAHGTEVERQRCMDLGAFAFFQKPVDIDLLRETLRKAKEKVRQNIPEEKDHEE
jgi:two-component system, OmpR family, response regulator CpxR